MQIHKAAITNNNKIHSSHVLHATSVH